MDHGSAPKSATSIARNTIAMRRGGQPGQQAKATAPAPSISHHGALVNVAKEASAKSAHAASVRPQTKGRIHIIAAFHGVIYCSSSSGGFGTGAVSRDGLGVGVGAGSGGMVQFLCDTVDSIHSPQRRYRDGGEESEGFGVAHTANAFSNLA